MFPWSRRLDSNQQPAAWWCFAYPWCKARPSSLLFFHLALHLEGGWFNLASVGAPLIPGVAWDGGIISNHQGCTNRRYPSPCQHLHRLGHSRGPLRPTVLLFLRVATCAITANPEKYHRDISVRRKGGTAPRNLTVPRQCEKVLKAPPFEPRFDWALNQRKNMEKGWWIGSPESLSLTCTIIRHSA